MRALLLLVFSGAAMAQAPVDVQKVLQRDFQARGQATMDRVVQDGVQRVCTESHDRPPAELAKRLEEDQLKAIVESTREAIVVAPLQEGLAASGPR